MSRETLSNQLFSIKNMKTSRRFCRALWASAFSRLASSGWYLVLNLCPKLGSTKKWEGNDGDWDERNVNVRENIQIIHLSHLWCQEIALRNTTYLHLTISSFLPGFQQIIYFFKCWCLYCSSIKHKYAKLRHRNVSIYCDYYN